MSAIEPFEALIGTWDVEAKHRLMDDAFTGWWAFEWLEGRRFVVLRSHADHELVPDAISVMGAPEDGDGLVQEYFDSRGVRRTYGTSIEDGVWRTWRDHPGFEQRFAATLADDAFEGDFDLAEVHGEWKHDMRVSFRRRA
jgi:hypothetical protein